ncbi:MAG: hypothetical protein GXO80_03205 [Chlorobi bacterium]|nr:hypothetical protein [Chlorobiota bacterium]
MQVTKKTKYILLISIFILIFSSVSAQENTDNSPYSDTLVTQNDTITKHRFSFSNFFKRRSKEKTEDTISQKKKFSFKNLFKRKNKNDSTLTQQDTIINDSLNQKKGFSLFHKNKSDSSTTSKENEKPESLTPGLWLKLNAEQQDSLLRAWDDYDRSHYVKKYTNSPRVKKIDMKRDKNFIDKLILRFSGNMSYKYRKKLINRRISRYRKTMIYDRLKKSDTSPDDTISDIKRYKTVNKQFKLQAKQEAVRKNKVSLKYDRKEQRLRRRYSLTDNEQIILNKGKGMRLRGSEKIIFKKARSKQEKFTEKLLQLRKKRSYALQNKEVKKRMKEDKKRINKRDKAQYKKLHKKKRDKEGNKKHDSSEYPKKWFR